MKETGWWWQRAVPMGMVGCTLGTHHRWAPPPARGIEARLGGNYVRTAYIPDRIHSYILLRYALKPPYTVATLYVYALRSFLHPLRKASRLHLSLNEPARR